MWQRLFSGKWGGALCSLVFLLAVMALFSATAVLQTTPVQAQDADKKDAAAEPSLDEGAASPDAKKEAASEEIAPGIPKNESFLHWLVRCLQWRYTIIFLFITFNLVALMVMNVLAVRRDSMVPQALVDAFEAHLNEKRYQEAYELAKADESFLGKVLAAGMAKLSSGYEPATQAMQEVGEEENMKMEHRLGYVALCAQIGPMFGLLGTVDGMVAAFDVISKSNTTPKPSALAQGIGTALVTTVVGLWIAIPAIAYYQIVRNRMAKLIREVGIVSESLMKRFSNVGASVRTQPQQQPQQR
jgi:biopolymer transport protein ExbB